MPDERVKFMQKAYGRVSILSWFCENLIVKTKNSRLVWQVLIF